MGDNIFRIVVGLIYLIVIVYFLGGIVYRRYVKRNKLSERNPKKDNQIALDEYVAKTFLEIKRNHVDPDIASEYDHTINASFEEIFNMFMSITPEIVQTILKIEKTMVVLQKEFDKSEIDKDKIDQLLESTKFALIQLEDASNKLLDRLVDVYLENQPQEGEVKIDSQLIEGYITIVNNLEEISINYTYHLQKLLKCFKTKYPLRVVEYNTISEKLIYVLYIVVTCCASRLDRHINVYNISRSNKI